MPFITEKQREERAGLADAIQAVTTIEPRQFANEIHAHVVRLMHEECLDVDTTLLRIEGILNSMQIHTCSGGNNVDGWKTRNVFLSPKQQRTIHAMLTLMLKMGGSFSPYADNTA